MEKLGNSKLVLSSALLSLLLSGCSKSPDAYLEEAQAKAEEKSWVKSRDSAEFVIQVSEELKREFEAVCIDFWEENSPTEPFQSPLKHITIAEDRWIKQHPDQFPLGEKKWTCSRGTFYRNGPIVCSPKDGKLKLDDGYYNFREPDEGEMDSFVYNFGGSVVKRAIKTCRDRYGDQKK